MAFIIFKDGYQGEDIHLVRNGAEFHLMDYINVPTGAIAYFIASYRYNSESTIFLARNAVAPLTPATFLSANFTNNPNYQGITIGMLDGVLQANSFTATSIYNFKILIIVVDSSGRLNEAIVKVHIHDQISSVRVTPSSLVLRPDIGEQKFSVIATFTSSHTFSSNPYTNIVEGDVSFYPNLTWALAPTSGIAYNSPTKSFSIVGSPAPSIHPGVVTLTASTYLTNTGSAAPTATAGIQILGPLNDFMVLEKINRTTNSGNQFDVLITGDGYINQADFDNHVNDFLSRLSEDIYLKPWDDLKKSITFWKLYLDSNDACCTVTEPVLALDPTTPHSVITQSSYVLICDAIINSLMEMRTSNATLGSRALTAAQLVNSIQSDYTSHQPLLNTYIKWNSLTGWFWGPNPTTGLPRTCTLSQLINFAGLPVNSDVNKTLADKIIEWRVFPSFPSNTLLITEGEDSSTATIPPTAMVIKNGVYEMWRGLTNRKYLEHTNTALGIRINGLVEGIYNFSDRRISKIQFNRIAHGLVNSGDLFFTNTGSLAPTGNTLLSNGHNVIVLVKGWTTGQFTANNLRDQVKGNVTLTPLLSNFTGQKDAPIIFNTATSGPEIPIMPYVMTPLPNDIIFKCIHEYMHNFLDDEYGLRNGSALSQPADIIRSDSSYNLQARQRLIPTGTTNISTNLIKWQWPRISKIGITGTAVTGSSPDFMVTIARQDLTHKFQQSDIVLLRSRNLKPHSIYDTAFNDGTSVPNTKYGGLMLISAVDVTNENELTLSLQIGESFNPTDFPVGSLILGVQIDTTTMRPETLVHPTIAARMQAANTGLVEVDNTSGKTEHLLPGAAFLTNLIRPSNHSKIVGLYAGGQIDIGYDFDRNIYHPAGICIMRNASSKYNGPAHIVVEGTPPVIKINYESAVSNYICPICRYIIIDAIDPMQHVKNDLLYELDYPRFNP